MSAVGKHMFKLKYFTLMPIHSIRLRSFKKNFACMRNMRIEIRYYVCKI